VKCFLQVRNFAATRLRICGGVIGYVPQKAVLFGKTVEEDLAYPFQIAKQKPDEGRMKNCWRP
jgi:ABC-type iron transport system FetAB ATPase subunit